MKHFDEYAYLVQGKHIPVCREVKQAIKRVERFKKQYTFKQREADSRIAFIEKHCSNTKGLPDMLKLALPQKVWLETAWGFYHDVEVTKTDPDTMKTYKAKEERRLIHEVPLVVARGSGKTTMASAIALVGQIFDGEYGADVQCLAPTRKQAGYLYDASRAMARNENSLLNLLMRADQLANTKHGFLYRETNSLFTISTSEYDTLDGTNCHYNVFDEVQAYEDDFIKIVNDGSSRKRRNWISWYITTNGTKRDLTFDRYYKIWLGVLSGEIDNDTIMPWLYKLDTLAEVHKPVMWVKAMPLLGITTEPETVALDIEMSKNDPVQQSELLTKTFNMPVNSYLAYFTLEECRGNRKQYRPELFIGSEERSARAVVGADLSDVNDICAVSFMIVDGDKRYFKTLKFVPRVRVDSRSKEQRDQYMVWEKNGELHVHEKDHNERGYIFEEVKRYVRENKILVVKVGLDMWKADEFAALCVGEWGDDVIYRVQQSVKGLSTGLKMYKAKLGAGNVIFDDDFVAWNHGNVFVKTDANNNVFPNKQQAKAKIDGFAAQLDAFICYEDNREELEYYFVK